MRNFNQKGVAIYLSVLILSGVLAISLGISTLLINELKIARDIGRFIPALYAADSGIERALYKIRKLGEFSSCPNLGDCAISATTLQNTGVYKVFILDAGVGWCSGATTCVRSLGSFVDTNRAIEVSI